MKNLNINTDNKALFFQFYDEITDITARALDIDRNYLDLNMSISEYALDSITITETIKKINKIYQLNLSPAIIFGHKTLDSFIKYLFDTHEMKIKNIYVNNKELLNNTINKVLVEETNTRQKEKNISSDEIPIEKIENAVVDNLCFNKITKEKLANNQQKTMSEDGIPNILKNENEIRKCLILISAENEISLKKNIETVLKYLEKNMQNEKKLLALERFLIFECDSSQERLALIIENIEELYRNLKDYLNGEKVCRNIYTGKVKKNKKRINLFLLNEDSKKLVMKWFRKGEIDKIAILWLHGIQVDWKILFKGHNNNHIEDKKDLLQLNFSE